LLSKISVGNFRDSTAIFLFALFFIIFQKTGSQISVCEIFQEFKRDLTCPSTGKTPLLPPKPEEVYWETGNQLWVQRFLGWLLMVEKGPKKKTWLR